MEKKAFLPVLVLLCAILLAGCGRRGSRDSFQKASDLKAALEEKPDQYRMLEEPIGEIECGMAVSPKTRYPQLVGQLNTFLADLKASGRGSSHSWRRR